MRRDVDERLDAAFDDSALRLTHRLVALRGDPKSGKSRTLWEALGRHARDREVFALRPPLIGDDAAPEARPLATFLEVAPRPDAPGMVLWIDGAHRHMERGLTRSNLRRLTELYPDAIVALTLHSSELARIGRFDAPLEKLLRSASRDLVLDAELSPDELARAREAYPDLAEDHELEWLPEWFAAVDLLRDRCRDSRASHPVGVAVAKAAIDWRRAGMLPAVTVSDLRGLADITLKEIAPQRTLDDAAFESGLAWAKEEVAARAALVQFVDAGSVAAYQAFDAVVSWAARPELFTA